MLWGRPPGLRGSSRTRSSASAALAAALLLTACGSRGVRAHFAEPFPTKLAAWRLFIGDPAALKPNAGVVPYDLNTPLFYVPVGTIFSKTFAFPDADQGGRQRIIETRLLVNGRSGWVTLPYVWNREQTEATLDVAADPATVHWVHPSGTRYTIDYVIPNTNQCKGCHDRSKTVTPIGPKARNLNKDFNYPEGRFNQLAYWTKIGYLKGAPPPDRAPKLAVWDD